MAIVQCRLRHRAAVSADIMEGGSRRKERRGVFFLLRPASLSSSACVKSFRTAVISFFHQPPPNPPPLPSHNYEYGKKCQDVFGEGAVDFREDADYFPEVHRVMIVFVRCCSQHMPGTRQAMGRSSPCPSNDTRDSHRSHKHNNRCPSLSLTPPLITRNA